MNPSWRSAYSMADAVDSALSLAYFVGLMTPRNSRQAP
jgi:hypothetical protein